MSKRPGKNHIIDEIHRFRREYAARFNNDLQAICRDIQEREARGEFRTVTRPPRRPTTAPSPNGSDSASS